MHNNDKTHFFGTMIKKGTKKPKLLPPQPNHDVYIDGS